MNEIDLTTPLLSIVTVVFNDIEGLKKTISSVKLISSPNIEYWVIDGNSSDGTKAFLELDEQKWIKFISELDLGLYDAMNKGLKNASGDFIVFINAGDLIAESFSWPIFFNSARLQAKGNETLDKVCIGQTIEKYGSDRYLRPGIGRENLAFQAPPHQATFYPRLFYESEQFRLDRPIGADGEYTGRAISKCEAIFVPQIVCEFSLGGLSSSYGSMRSLSLRWKEVSNLKDAYKLLIKVFLWYSLPRKLFYKILARGKYTEL